MQRLGCAVCSVICCYCKNIVHKLSAQYVQCAQYKSFTQKCKGCSQDIAQKFPGGCRFHAAQNGKITGPLKSRVLLKYF